MTKYRCPTYPTPCDDEPNEFMAGCGHVFEAEPDSEGMVDCPECGMWFTPSMEPETEVIADLSNQQVGELLRGLLFLAETEVKL